MQHRMLQEAKKAMVPWMNGQPIYAPISSNASSQGVPILHSGETQKHTKGHKTPSRYQRTTDNLVPLKLETLSEGWNWLLCWWKASLGMNPSDQQVMVVCIHHWKWKRGEDLGLQIKTINKTLTFTRGSHTFTVRFVSNGTNRNPRVCPL